MGKACFANCTNRKEVVTMSKIYDAIKDYFLSMDSIEYEYTAKNVDIDILEMINDIRNELDSMLYGDD